MTGADLQRWSREVAEDPGAPAFVPLARAYRRQGRREAARQVLIHGLERNPEHVDAHALLALVYVEEGERQRAGDEWEIILRLDPQNFDASRGLGFLALERGDLAGSRRHLGNAARARPGDPAVQQALEVLSRREARSEDDTGVPASGQATNGRREPTGVFTSLARDAPFLGALLMDAQGLVLAGSLRGLGRADGEALGALLSPAVDEARRTVGMMKLGSWSGMMLDCEGALLHVAPVGDSLVVLAARDDAPAGWVVRTAGRARELARSFLEVER